jgi:hypothetical protein
VTIRVLMEVTARPRSDGAAEVVFRPLRGLEPLRDAHGGLVQFGIPLDRPDDDLADLLRTFARWVADLAAADIQAQRAAVHRAATTKPK